MRTQLEAALPDAQVIDFREGNPALTRGLDNATSILSLICLVAMVLGAIGVAMAMHAHLEQRMDMLAILKAVGADSADLLRIFLLQTLGLGLAGGLLGVAAGVGVMAALPAAFGQLLPVHVILQFPWQSVLAGLATGLLTTLLFCLPPLLDVRAVRPVLVLRRLVEPNAAGIGEFFARWWARRLQLGIAAAVVAALGGIAWALSDSPKVGAWFAFLFTVALVVLLAMAAGALRFVRFLLDRTRLRLPSSLRHGLANLYRPGNQSAPVLAALGTGVMLILAVYLMQKDLLRDLRETAAPSLPNVFLVDIRTGEVDGVKAFFAHQAGVNRPLNLIPVVMGRFISINGEPVDQMEGQHYPRRMLQNAELSWADTPPEGDKVTAGSWWTSSSASEIAVSEGVARRLHLGVGSAMELETGGTTRALKVAAIYRADGQHLGARVQFVLPSGLISNEPSTWYGGARIDPNRVPEMERAFFAAYPTITVVNVADVLAADRGRRRSNHLRGPAACRFLDSRRFDNSCLEHRQHALPPHAGSGRAQNAGSHADAHRAHLQRGVQCFRVCSPARSASSSPTFLRECSCTGSKLFSISSGRPPWLRWQELRFWPRPRDGSRATGFLACGRSRSCAKSRHRLNRAGN